MIERWASRATVPAETWPLWSPNKRVGARAAAGRPGPHLPGDRRAMKTESLELFADGFFLTRDSMHWFRDHYLPAGTSFEDPAVSPLLADDVSEVAPAWVWTAGFDPLRDEGRAYAERLHEAGVQTHYRCYDDLIHGFFSMGVIPGALEIIEEMGAQLGGLIRSESAD